MRSSSPKRALKRTRSASLRRWSRKRRTRCKDHARLIVANVAASRICDKSTPWTSAASACPTGLISISSRSCIEGPSCEPRRVLASLHRRPEHPIYNNHQPQRAQCGALGHAPLAGAGAHYLVRSDGVSPAGDAGMRTMAVAKFGGTDELGLRDAPVPSAGAGEALVKLEYAGVNFIDVYMRSGRYARSQTYQTPLPMTLGMEGAGTVVALGAGAAEVEIGDRVAYCIVRGSYAEYAAVPASKLVKVPPAVPLDIAAALMLQGLTAHYLSHSAYALAP